MSYLIMYKEQETYGSIVSSYTRPVLYKTLESLEDINKIDKLGEIIGAFEIVRELKIEAIHKKEEVVHTKYKTHYEVDGHKVEIKEDPASSGFTSKTIFLGDVK